MKKNDFDFLEFYKKNLMDIGIIIKQASEQNIDKQIEMNEIYKLMFVGLLREGYPHNKNEIKTLKKDVVISDTMTEEERKAIEEDVLNYDIEKEIIININGEDYKCLDSELKNILGNEFESVMNTNINVESVIEMPKEEPVIVIPEEPEEKVIIEEPEKKEDIIPVKETKYDNMDDLLKILPSDENYPDDEMYTKYKKSLLCNIHHLVLKQGNMNFGMNIVIYPLNTNTSEVIATDIFAILVMDDRYRTGISGKIKAAEAEFDKMKFIIRGNWDKGEFKSQINLLNKDECKIEIAEEEIEYIIPKERTSTIYKKIKSGKDVLNIFPVIFKNNDMTGLTPILTILDDGGKPKVYNPNGGDYITLIFNGKNTNIKAYWVGNENGDITNPKLVCELE